MPAFLALVPPVVWRWVAILGVSLAAGLTCFIFGYNRGVNHQQGKDAIASEKEYRDALALDHKHLVATQKRISDYERQISDLQSVPPQVVHDRVVQYVRGMCKPTVVIGQNLPDSASGSPARPSTDSTVRPPDIDASELEHDIKNSELNSAALRLCSGWVHDNGGADR